MKPYWEDIDKLFNKSKKITNQVLQDEKQLESVILTGTLALAFIDKMGARQDFFEYMNEIRTDLSLNIKKREDNDE
jgi:hypothetical protein